MKKEDATPSIKSFYTWISPEEAKKYLEKNFEANRKLRPTVVARYAQDMADGRWDAYSAEPISFSDTGKVLNGQHRMAAVIKSGVPLYTEVRWGVPESSYAFFDAGLKRTVGDGLPPDMANKTCVSAACRVALALSLADEICSMAFDTGRHKGTIAYTTTAGTLAFYEAFEERYPGVIREAASFGSSKSVSYMKWTPKAIAVSAMAMLITDPECFERFKEAVLDEKNAATSVLSYRLWAIKHHIKAYNTQERDYIEWCAAANVWRELHGYRGKEFRYAKNTNPELLGFKPEMFDVLGNRKKGKRMRRIEG